MNKTTNKYLPELRECSLGLVLNGEGQHVSRWAAIVSIASKIGCAPQTLNEWHQRGLLGLLGLGDSARQVAACSLSPQHLEASWSTLQGLGRLERSARSPVRGGAVEVRFGNLVKCSVV